MFFFLLLFFVKKGVDNINAVVILDIHSDAHVLLQGIHILEHPLKYFARIVCKSFREVTKTLISLYIVSPKLGV